MALPSSMAGRQVLLERLQVLQSSRPLETPPVSLGTTALPQLNSEALSDEAKQGNAAQLHEAIRTADFWIALLEGENCDQIEESKKYKLRHRASLRQIEANADTQREVEAEQRRLRGQLKQLKGYHDGGSQDAQEESMASSPKKTTEDLKLLASRKAAIEAELQSEQEERAELEKMLVQTKVGHAASLQLKDSMQYVIEHYEEQLQSLNPNFEPVDPHTLCEFLPSRALDAAFELDSVGSEQTGGARVEERAKNKRTFVKKGIAKIKRMLSSPPLLPPESPRRNRSAPPVLSLAHPMTPRDAEPAAMDSVPSENRPDIKLVNSIHTEQTSTASTGINPSPRLKRWQMRAD